MKALRLLCVLGVLLGVSQVGLGASNSAKKFFFPNPKLLFRAGILARSPLNPWPRPLNLAGEFKGSLSSQLIRTQSSHAKLEKWYQKQQESRISKALEDFLEERKAPTIVSLGSVEVENMTTEFIEQFQEILFSDPLFFSTMTAFGADTSSLKLRYINSSSVVMEKNTRVLWLMILPMRSTSGSLAASVGEQAYKAFLFGQVYRVLPDSKGRFPDYQMMKEGTPLLIIQKTFKASPEKWDDIRENLELAKGG